MRVLYLLPIFLLVACQTLPAPEREGVALPTPSTPLSQTGPYLGDKPTDIDALVRQFDETVFKTEHQGVYPYVRKWAGPINYAIMSDKDIDGRVVATVAKVGLLSGVEGKRVYEAANVGFITRPGVATDYHCHVEVYSGEDGAIIQARIYVGPALPDDYLAECIEEEFTQALGPGNDTTNLEQSLWRPYEQKTFHGLTWSDAVILRALYDERLRPGMHRDKALPIVRRIIGELLAELAR